MKEQLQNRLSQLEAEYQKGAERLQTLEAEISNVKSSMLRISGAIQVLKEELGKEETITGGGEVGSNSILESTEES